jgi:hypothetical protein
MMDDLIKAVSVVIKLERDVNILVSELAAAKSMLADARNDLTQAAYTDGEWVAPEEFYIVNEGQGYYIHLDFDGYHNHKVRPIQEMK